MTKGDYLPRQYWRHNLIAISLIVGLLNLAIPSTATSQVTAIVIAPVELKLRSESQLKTEAGWYDTAIREISRIATLDLTQSESLKTAQAILEKHVPNLRYSRSKLATIGLSDSTFLSAVRARAKDSKSAELLALDVIKDPTAIFNTSGGQAVGDQMRRSLDGDSAKLKRIAARLQQASEDLKQKIKTHHFNGTSRSFFRLNVESATASFLLPELSAVEIGLIVVAVAVIAAPPLGFALLHIGNAVFGVTLLASGVLITASLITAAVNLIGNLISNLSTDEGQDKVAACHRQVDDRYRRCMNGAAELGIFRLAAEVACYSEWVVASGGCLFTP